MPTLRDIANDLCRPTAALLQTLKQFDIPPLNKSTTGEAHACFLRLITYLRLSQALTTSLLKIWSLELKLMRLLHLDHSDSTTWMIDGHLDPGPADRTLFLSKTRLDAPIKACSYFTHYFCKKGFYST